MLLQLCPSGSLFLCTVPKQCAELSFSFIEEEGESSDMLDIPLFLFLAISACLLRAVVVV